VLRVIGSRHLAHSITEGHHCQEEYEQEMAHVDTHRHDNLDQISCGVEDTKEVEELKPQQQTHCCLEGGLDTLVLLLSIFLVEEACKSKRDECHQEDRRDKV
jgi:hypothetical protein